MIRSSVLKHPTCSSWAIAESVVRCRTSGYSPPCNSCKNCTTNSISRMPPCPVFTSTDAVPAESVRCSIRRFSDLISAISAAPRNRRNTNGSIASQNVFPRLRSPATGRHLISAWRSQVRPRVS